MVQIFQKLTHRITRYFRWLWRQRGTPGERARGLALGVFAGCLPLFGFQTLLGLLLARLLRGNQLLAASGTWISNPVTYLPLYWFNYQAGCFLLGREMIFDDFAQFSWNNFWGHGLFVSSRLLIGSTFVGICAGALSGCIVYTILRLFSR